ncbi:MAG: hypothetical protein M3Q84_09765 [Actinomycetota bacterium]|nr:hypothetical protein [Actinomycetota bacterium]
MTSVVRPWRAAALAAATAPSSQNVTMRLDRGRLGLFDRDGTEIEVVVAAVAPWCFEARIRSPLHPVTYTGAGCRLDPAVRRHQAGAAVW